MADTFDVVVIGGGPGGYTAAIRAAQLGFKTACIDDWTRADGKPAPGGTCTNVGCIPSKALLQSSENYENVAQGFVDHGIDVKGLSIDVKRMLARKDKVVGQNNDGILYLFRKNKITFFHGRGAFTGRGGETWQIQVHGAKPADLDATHVVIATGSKPRALPGVAFDNVRILDNDGALAIPMEPTVDILSATRSERRPGSVMVGFALETGDALAKGRAKLERKDLDLIVVNDALEPGAAFEVETNRVALLDRDGAAQILPLQSKREVAEAILDAVERTLGR